MGAIEVVVRTSLQKKRRNRASSKTTSFNTLSETHRYNKKLVRAFKENTVIDAGTLYEHHFTLPFSKQLRKNTAPPYFPRHHWLKQLGMIEVAHQKRQARALSSKLRGKGKKKSVTSKRKQRGEIGRAPV